MPTVTLNPAVGANAPVDGNTGSGDGNDVSFATIVAQNGQEFSNTTDTGELLLVRSSATLNQFRNIQRTLYGFDLSSLIGATITSAVFSLYVTAVQNLLGGTPAMDIVSGSPASSSTLANADYQNGYGSTAFASTAYASISTTAYNDFTLSAAGIAFLQSKIPGYGFLGVRSSWDRSATFGGVWADTVDLFIKGNFADKGSNEPKLTLTYTQATFIPLL